MSWALLRAILIPPANALVTIPGLILWLSAGAGASWRLAPPDSPWFWAALVLMAGGLVLMGWTMTLFTRRGEGTPAPWDPPKKLVVAGIYQYVRNPMISGAFTFLMGETLPTGSLPLLGWALLFALANAVYIPLFEETGLEKRFGEDYRRYRASVPRCGPAPHPVARRGAGGLARVLYSPWRYQAYSRAPMWSSKVSSSAVLQAAYACGYSAPK